MTHYRVKDSDFNQTGQDANPLVTNAVPAKPTSPYGTAATNGWGLSKSFKGGRLLEDDNGRAIIFPVIITNPNLDIPSNTITPNLDSYVSLNSALAVTNQPYLYTGAGNLWDRARENTNLYANASDVTTATFTSAAIPTYNMRAVVVAIRVTTFTDTSYTPEVDYLDANGTYQILWQQKTVKTGAADTVIVFGLGAGGPASATVPGVIDGATVGDIGLGTADSATLSQLVIFDWPLSTSIKIKVTKVHAAGTYAANYSVIGAC